MVRGRLEGVTVNGSLKHRLPNNLNVTIAGAEAAAMLGEMRELALSSGAACASAVAEPSHVLAALGLEPAAVASSLRFGLHRFTTEAEVDQAATVVVDTARRLRREALGAQRWTA